MLVQSVNFTRRKAFLPKWEKREVASSWGGGLDSEWDVRALSLDTTPSTMKQRNYQIKNCRKDKAQELLHVVRGNNFLIFCRVLTFLAHFLVRSYTLLDKVEIRLSSITCGWVLGPCSRIETHCQAHSSISVA